MCGKLMSEDGPVKGFQFGQLLSSILSKQVTFSRADSNAISPRSEYCLAIISRLLVSSFTAYRCLYRLRVVSTACTLSLLLLPIVSIPKLLNRIRSNYSPSSKQVYTIVSSSTDAFWYYSIVTTNTNPPCT
jgi:hypothetical protein